MPPLLAPIIQLFFTVYYFFYFLAKGKPEWKCPKEKHGGDCPEFERLCCEEEGNSTMTARCTQRAIYERITSIPSTIRQYWTRFAQWIRTVPQVIKNRFSLQSLRNGLKQMCGYVVSLLTSIWQIISTFFFSILSLFLLRRPPSKSMPTSEVIYSPHAQREVKSIPPPSIASTPVPFHPSSVPPPPPPPPPPRSKVLSTDKEISTTTREEESALKGGAFYTTRVFDTTDEARTRHSPVQPATKEDAWKSIVAEIAGSGGSGDEDMKEGINRTPNRTVKERLREASLTPTHKSTFEYPNGTVPRTQSNTIQFSGSNCRVDAPKGWGNSHEDRTIRAKSAGPPRVSRIEDSSSNEAQFIFRAHGSDEDVGYNYRMGRSVHLPISEIELMRPTMNRQIDSRATTPSIWSCNTSRVSTPALNTRDNEGLRHRGRSRGRVGETARTWPPPPNAEGADIGKECFVDGNGIVTTACTRIVQKKNEESWRWFDDNGRMIDEKCDYSLMGDKDEVRRDGPYQANHYSQHYFVDRDGTTRFENTHRQYDRDYVVESVCRNY